jgi:hypothetical protein
LNKDVGLITNGLLLNKLPKDTLRKLKWLRISLSGVDYGLEENYFRLDITRFPDFYGLSYVYTPKTTSEHIATIHRIAHRLQSQYVRIVPNCYTPKEIEWGRKHILKAIKKYPEMFMQIKDYSIPQSCYWKYIKPFVNSDGYVYQCSTCSLFGGYFSEPWRIDHWSKIYRIYDTPLSSFDNSKCSLCFYSKQNALLSDLLTNVKHKEFL